MLQNVASFPFGQRVLGERRQHIRVGMIDRDRRSLQTLSNDFWYFLHLTHLFVPLIPAAVECAIRPRDLGTPQTTSFRLTFAFRHPGLHSLL
jgi:hypothetical protein